MYVRPGWLRVVVWVMAGVPFARLWTQLSGSVR